MRIILVVFVASLVSARFQRPPTRLEVKFQECREETGVSDEVALKVRSHLFDFDHDEIGKCFTMCVATRAGFCDSHLRIITSGWETIRSIPRQKLIEGRDFCNALEAPNGCETVFKRFQCIFEKVPEIPVNRK